MMNVNCENTCAAIIAYINECGNNLQAMYDEGKADCQYVDNVINDVRRACYQYAVHNLDDAELKLFAESIYNGDFMRQTYLHSDVKKSIGSAEALFTLFKNVQKAKGGNDWYLHNNGWKLLNPLFADYLNN